MTKIGIGITTRNRANILPITLKHFDHFTPHKENYKFFLVDDNSDHPDPKYGDYSFINDCHWVEYKKSNARLGIAKAKNECIKALKDCDFLFLFDDDCFPKQENWAKVYIDTYNQTGIEHMMFMIDGCGHHKIMDNGVIQDYSNCGGVLLFFTRNAIDVLGGWNPNYHIYGMDHASLSERAKKAKLTKGHSHVVPSKANNVIYSLDFHLNGHGVQPPLHTFNPGEYTSSLIGEESKIQSYIRQNQVVYASDREVHVDI